MGLLRLPVDPNDRRALWHGETRRTKFKPVDDNFPRLCLRREGVGGSVRDRATVSHLGIRGGAGQMPARRADSGALNPYLRSSCASGGSIRGRPAHHRYDRAKDVSAPRSDQTTSARRALRAWSLLRNATNRGCAVPLRHRDAARAQPASREAARAMEQPRHRQLRSSGADRRGHVWVRARSRCSFSRRSALL
jgi:hypothetical protein